MYLPSDVMRMRATSAGVPTNAPTAPAAIPIPALMKNDGGLPSVLQNQVFKLANSNA